MHRFFALAPSTQLQLLLALEKRGSTLKFHRSVLHIFWASWIRASRTVGCVVLWRKIHSQNEYNYANRSTNDGASPRLQLHFARLAARWLECWAEEKKNEFCGRRTATVCHAVHIDNRFMQTQAMAIQKFYLVQLNSLFSTIIVSDENAEWLVKCKAAIFYILSFHSLGLCCHVLFFSLHPILSFL